MQPGPPAASQATLEAENRVLKARLAALTGEVVRNDSILHKSQQRELEVLGAGSLGELLKILIQGLKSSYQLEDVVLVLRDPEHEIRHLLWGDPVEQEHRDELRFVDQLSQLAPMLEGLERPWLGPFRRDQHAALFAENKALASVALIPLRHNDALEGLLVFGSADAARFEPELASDFLAHLGLVSAVCLENSINRARLLRSGFTDFLTGFYNRRYLQARLREELARAQRLGQTLAFLMIDVDHFKQVNDRFGHLAGDAVLREIARRIGAQMRTSDTGARFGGDEFAMLLQQGSAVDGERVAQRVLQAVRARPIEINPNVTELVSLSIGVAAAEPAPVLRDHNALGEQLIAAADAALYRAKNQGRNQVALAEGSVR
jgi:two-component system, cell cycle response regulator